MSTAELTDVNPPYLFPAYQSTIRRAPQEQLVVLPREWFHHLPGPAFGRIPVGPNDNDLTRQHEGRPHGQRILLNGRLLDSDGRGVPRTLVEIWQANSSGRYVDSADPAFMPLDPNFSGAGRTITDNDGRFEFRTIQPAPYPGELGSFYRPAHIHVSLFGPDLGSRLITQCYFEGDPLIAHDAIAQSIPDPKALERLLLRLNPELCEPGDVDSAIAYDWTIVLRGRNATPMER
jgi:protocatechuate 3,4-dioxygenase, beta subunit